MHGIDGDWDFDTQTDDASREMSASVVMVSQDRGRFVLSWGPHEWTAEFRLVPNGV